MTNLATSGQLAFCSIYSSVESLHSLDPVDLKIAAGTLAEIAIFARYTCLTFGMVFNITPLLFI